MKKKRAFTLLEIMIVIFLIGLIGSVIGYNMKGSMDEGRAFKTKQAIIRAQDLLELELARGADPKNVEDKPESFLKAAGVVKDVDKALYDGWGEKMKVEIDAQGDIVITSEKYNSYKRSKTAHRGRDAEG